MRSTGKWYTSLEQPHDEIHLAIGGQDHQPIKATTTETYDENGDVLTSETKVSPQVSRGHDHDPGGEPSTSRNADCQPVTQNHLWKQQLPISDKGPAFCDVYIHACPRTGLVYTPKHQSKRVLFVIKVPASKLPTPLRLVFHYSEGVE